MKNEVLEKTENDRATQALPIVEPRIDVMRSDDAVVIQIELPGVDEASVSVDVDQDLLTISGPRVREVQDGLTVLRRETRDCRYRRSFRLSDQVDRGSVKAVLKHGVLRLVLPIKEESKPRKIEITTD